MSAFQVHAALLDYECSATVTIERETFTDPGGTWVEDVVVTRGGHPIEFEGLPSRERAQIEWALIEVARERSQG